MGRPIKNKYINPYGTGAKRPETGGEGVSSTGGNVVLASITRGLGYYVGNVSATIAAPTLSDGVAASVGTVYLFANGAVKAVQLTNAGFGYLAAPTISFFNGNTNQATATATIDVSTTSADSIKANCFFTGDSAGITTADILKQRGSKSFVCKNSVTQTLKLVVAPSANNNPVVGGTMTITATFADNSTFTIAKITDRLVYSSTGAKYKWNLGGVAANVSATDITVSVASQ